MNRFAALAMVAALSLGGCGTFGIGTPVTPPAGVAIVIATTDYGFEKTYNFAATQFVALAPTLDAATKVKAKGILHQLMTCPRASAGVTVDPSMCSGYVAVAHKAAKLGDQATLTAQIALIVSLASEVTTLIHSPPPPAP